MRTSTPCSSFYGLINDAPTYCFLAAIATVLVLVRSSRNDQKLFATSTTIPTSQVTATRHMVTMRPVQSHRFAGQTSYEMDNSLSYSAEQKSTSLPSHMSHWALKSVAALGAVFSAAAMMCRAFHRQPCGTPSDSFVMMGVTGDTDVEAKSISSDELRGSVADGWIVQCRVYNLDRYGFIPIANKLLQKEVDGIWHAAIAVYGSEYWFDHQIEKQDLSTVQFARGFAPAYVYDLGVTKVNQADFEKWLKEVMDFEYNIEKYECFKHNCHHFANDAALYLTGNSIPHWCIDHGEDGLDALVKSGANEVLTRSVANKIARIMMVSWGRYEKERFTKWEEDSSSSQGFAASTVLPVYTKEDAMNGMARPQIMADC